MDVLMLHTIFVNFHLNMAIKIVLIVYCIDKNWVNFYESSSDPCIICLRKIAQVFVIFFINLTFLPRKTKKIVKNIYN